MRSDADGESARRLVVTEDTGERIDALLARLVPELSRSRAAQLLEEGCVRVNGASPRKSYRPVIGDEITVALPAAIPPSLDPEPIPLDILFEDADLLVLNKPAGLVVHPAPGHRTGTLVHALLHHIEDLSGIGGVLRPGIVHRLDRDTSGLMLVAKNDASHRALAAALKRRAVRRVYVVASWGHLAQNELVVDAPIGRSSTDRKRMAVVDAGRSAITRFRRLARWRAADLLSAELETGRTHQIRVHLAHVGHPVVGDTTYGSGGARRISGPAQRWARELAAKVPRQFLHACELRFEHPTTGRAMHFESPLPADLAAAAQWAEATSAGR